MKTNSDKKTSCNSCSMCSIALYVVLSLIIGFPFAYVIKMIFPEINFTIPTLSILIGLILLCLSWIWDKAFRK